METVVTLLLSLAAVYTAVGICLAPFLHARALPLMDAGTHGTGILFRLVITPGLVALWPLVLRQWRRSAKAGAPAPPDSDHPVPARRLRALHGLYTKAGAVLLPALAALALWFRPGEPRQADALPSVHVTPAPLPVLDGQRDDLFPGFAIHARFLSGPGARQIELAIDQDLPLASPLLYWMPPDPGTATTPPLFIGAVWGPGNFRFALPPQASPDDGQFVILSLAQGIALNRELQPRTEAR